LTSVALFVQIPGMVELNWSLAVAFISSSMRTTTPTAHSSPSADFLAPLLRMPVSTRAVEVVNALCEQTEMPADFLQQYTTHCLSACERAADAAIQVYSDMDTLIPCLRILGFACILLSFNTDVLPFLWVILCHDRFEWCGK
jgi:hypothetical protein